MSEKIKVAILGAGPSGISQLIAFKKLFDEDKSLMNKFEIKCFDKNSTFGGLWSYDWHSSLDKNSEIAHASMYGNLWSNGPKECLEFDDYTFDEHFGKPISAFPPREALKDYLEGRVRKFQLEGLMTFSTVARWVQYKEKEKMFHIILEDLVKKETYSEDFHYCIIATGHFSTPNYPQIEGIEKFPGRFIHSHDVRHWVQLADKHVLVIGSSYSAEDMVLQGLKYGAKKVTNIYRNTPFHFHWPTPEKVTAYKGLKELRSDRSAVTGDGTVIPEIDVVICATGYKHHFPYLSSDLRIVTERNTVYPNKLYKGLLFQKNSRLIYLGMQDQYFSFNMFDVQATYAARYISGQIQLPQQKEIDDDVTKWFSRFEKLASPQEEIRFQRDYIIDVSKQIQNYPKVNWEMMAEMFLDWEDKKDEDISTYRDASYKSTFTGTQSEIPSKPWYSVKEFTLESYVKNSY